MLNDEAVQNDIFISFRVEISVLSENYIQFVSKKEMVSILFWISLIKI